MEPLPRPPTSADPKKPSIPRPSGLPTLKKPTQKPASTARSVTSDQGQLTRENSLLAVGGQGKVTSMNVFLFCLHEFQLPSRVLRSILVINC